MSDVFEQLREELPAIIFRDKVDRLGFNPRSLANMDCQGKGPKDRIRVGRRIAYPRDSFVDWVASMQKEV